MHTVAMHLAPIIGAEKSRLAFYIAGGALAAWAVIVSVGIGLRKPSDFPNSVSGQRAVIAISVVLVLAAASMAVVTSGTPAKPASAAAGNTSETAP